MEFTADFYKEDTLGDICIARGWYEYKPNDKFFYLVSHYTKKLDENGKTNTILFQLSKEELEYFETIKPELYENRFIRRNNAIHGPEKYFSLESSVAENFFPIKEAEEYYKDILRHVQLFPGILGRGFSTDISDTLTNFPPDHSLL